MAFIIDCPYCKAKVAAGQEGRVARQYVDEEAGMRIQETLLIGKCPSCETILAGFSHETLTDNDSDYNTSPEMIRRFS